MKLSRSLIVNICLSFSLLICFFIFLSGGISIIGNLSLALSGDTSPGTVSLLIGNRPSVAFTDKNGNSHIAPIKGMFTSSFSDRQVVSVVYNIENPSNFRIEGFTTQWLAGLIGILVGFIGGLASFVFLDFASILAAFGVQVGNKGPKAPQPQPKSTTTPSPMAPYESQSSASGGALHVDTEMLKSSFGPLTKLIDDSDVSDIILTSANGIYVKKGNQVTKTDVTISSQLKYEQLIDRIMTISDHSLSIAKPIVDGMVTPMIRIHAVHKSLCEEGPYITLRISRFHSVKFVDVVNGTLAPRDVHFYLRSMLLTGHTILIAGEVGTGKTTLIRGLASTIPQSESILVIEDTPEIKIEHPSVRYIRTRESNIEGAGKVSPSECIRAGMRMAMNRIIFGEIRDPEAAESFIDVCVSGHPGMSTIHSRSAQDAVTRLELLLARQQPGVDRFALREQIATAVHVIVYIKVCKETGKRRISEVIELRAADDQPIQEQVMFQYSASGKMPVWKVVNRKSFFEQDLKDFEGGATLANTPDWLTLNK